MIGNLVPVGEVGDVVVDGLVPTTENPADLTETTRKLRCPHFSLSLGSLISSLVGKNFCLLFFEAWKAQPACGGMKSSTGSFAWLHLRGSFDPLHVEIGFRTVTL